MNFLEIFHDWKDLEEYPADSVIFSEKNPADVIYVIISGEVELTLQGESLGSERTGGIIGEMAIINSATHSATATTRTRVTLARLNRAQFRKIASENAKFSFHAMAALANRLRAVDKFITRRFEPVNGGPSVPL